MNKTIALFQPGQTAVIASTPLYQYDYGQILEISGLELPETFTVDFGGVCDAETKPWLGENNSVVIPDEYLQTGQSINAYIFLHTGADDGETEYKISIVVIPRPERTQETPTPQQQSVIDQAIAALNAGAESASASAASAALAASHYPRIIGGEWYVWSVEDDAFVSTGIAAQGADGYSPTVQVTSIEGGHRVTITDAAGPHTFDVLDGRGGGAGAVESVNGKTGEVTLNAEDVGALPDTTTLDTLPDGTTYKRATGAQLQQIGTNAAAIRTQGGEIDALQADVDAIESKIPAQASASNQLADKEFVNSSINSSAAYFRGAFATHAALMAVQWQTSDPAAENYVSNNDYAYVADDETHDDEAWRYIYVLQPGGQNNGWQPQFRVNESPLTAAQLAALNSGATAALIEQISANAAAIALRQAIINASGILKGGGNGQVTAAVAGTDYLAPSALTPYRTAVAQDVIDAAQDTAIAGKAPASVGVYIGTCSTAAATQAKTVTVNGTISLDTNPMILVHFKDAQTYNGTPTLNVNGTGAKNIGRVIGTNAARYEWSANEVLLLLYDGTQWVIVDGGLATTSYYGVVKLYTGATSSSTTLALTPESLNRFAQYMISGVPVYSTSATYAVGDRVRYGNYIYTCIVAITTGETWTDAHWEALPPLLDLIEAAYVKPSDGIPYEDMSPFVKAALSGSVRADITQNFAAANKQLARQNIDAQPATVVVTVSGTTPTIIAEDNHRYVCGEVATLDITLPDSGMVDVTFESGSTATVLTVTPPTGVTVKWANDFDPTSLDADTTYEINIMGGLGVAASWT